MRSLTVCDFCLQVYISFRFLSLMVVINEKGNGGSNGSDRRYADIRSGYENYRNIV